MTLTFSGLLRQAAVDLVFCDLPSVPPGAMGRFLLTQMAAVAELEVGLIGERTKAALAAAKARGVKLGNPNGARALRGKQVGNAGAVARSRRTLLNERLISRASWMTSSRPGSPRCEASLMSCTRGASGLLVETRGIRLRCRDYSLGLAQRSKTGEIRFPHRP